MTIEKDTQMTDTQDFFLTSADVEEQYGIDLITAETIRHGLIEVTRHMHGTLQRSAFSSIVRDGMDFGVCVHVVADDESTELIAATEGCTMFAFTQQHMTNLVLGEYGVGNLGPGDTLLCNDSFRGGIHNADLNLFRVVHDEHGKPAFVITDAAHVFDVGGPSAGGFNLQAENMFEEGLRIPPTLLTSGDVPVRSAMNLLLDNTRSPWHMVGDVRALLGTLRAGEERMRSLMDRYGSATVKAAAQYALGLSERRMRRALTQIPDGEYFAEQAIDDDGVTTDPVMLKVAFRIKGDEAEIDFSGTDRQTIGPVTTGWAEASRSLIGPKVLLDPRHPMNSGMMRPFQVLLPVGSVVLGLPPTSQNNHTELGAKIASLMLRVVSQAIPEHATAADSGASGAVLVFGTDNRPSKEDQPFGAVLLFGGGWGGTTTADGISYCLSALYNCRANVIEFVEKEAPLIVWEWDTVMDSAGAGKYRGGFGPAYTFEAQAATTCVPLLDSAKFSPLPVEGGAPGMTSYGMLVKKDDRTGPLSWNGLLPAERLVPIFGKFDDEGRPDPELGVFGNGTRYQTGKAQFTITPGEVLRLQTASAAGCGDPFTRDPSSVLNDYLQERVSVAHAKSAYGVVIDAPRLKVDEEATRALRADTADHAPGDLPPSHFAGWPVTEAEFDDLVSSLRPVAIAQEA
ncbi:MAG: hyuB1 [Marmoricola sp.]|nr:hyuB1 [Marmoricola sp.]